MSDTPPKPPSSQPGGPSSNPEPSGARRRRRRRRRRGPGQKPAPAVDASASPAPSSDAKAPARRKRRRRKKKAVASAGNVAVSKPAASPPAPRRRRLRVVAAVITRGEEILVSLRHPKRSRPSQWEFPGGKLEKGESERQALVREIREELGVRCEVRALVSRVVYPYPDTDVEIAFYDTRIVEGTPQPLVMAELRWVCRSELEQLDFLEADRDFVAQLARGRK